MLDSHFQLTQFAFELTESYSVSVGHTKNMPPNTLPYTKLGTYGPHQLVQIVVASPTYFGQMLTIVRLLIDNGRQFQPDLFLFPMRQSLEAGAIHMAVFGDAFSWHYNSARIALSNPLKLPLTRSVTSTTSSWLSSSWKPAA